MKFIKVINIAHTFGVVWLLSLVIFTGAFISGVTKGEFSQEAMILVITVVTGLFAFLGALVLYLVHYVFLRKKSVLGTHSSVRKGVSPMVYILAGVILALLGVFSIQGAYFLGQTNKPVELNRNISDITPTPQVQVKYVDSDPVVTCTSSHSQCSGLTIQARKSQCSNIYCCQVGDKWSVYPSESECAAAQPKKEKQATYPPCTITYSDLGAITHYTIPPEECASKQTNQKVYEAQRDTYDQCVRNYGAENCKR